MKLIEFTLYTGMAVWINPLYVKAVFRVDEGGGSKTIIEFDDAYKFEVQESVKTVVMLLME